jgi:hypothetical protein
VELCRAILKQLETKEQALFTILPETTNTLWDLVVKDADGVTYCIQDEEAVDLHKHLLKDRNLIYNIDLIKKEISYQFNG